MRTFHLHMDWLGTDIPTYPNILALIAAEREARERHALMSGANKDMPRIAVSAKLDNERGLFQIGENVCDLNKVIVNVYVERDGSVTADAIEKTPFMPIVERPKAASLIGTVFFDRSSAEFFIISTARMLYGTVYRLSISMTREDEVQFFCCHEESYSANMSFIRAYFEKRWAVLYLPMKYEFPVMENLGQSNRPEWQILDPTHARSVHVFTDEPIQFSLSRFQSVFDYLVDPYDFDIRTEGCAAKFVNNKLEVSFFGGFAHLQVVPRHFDRILIGRSTFPTSNLHLDLRMIHGSRR